MNIKSHTMFIKIIIFILLLPATVISSEKVSIQLCWDHQFQFAGYYAAKWQGYFEEAGFDVDIRSDLAPGWKILSAVTEVAEGRADFGIGTADILLAKDKGNNIVVLATFFQQSPVEFYAKKDTELTKPADLTRLKVARIINDPIDMELQAMLLVEGINPNQVKPYPHEPGIDLESGKVDVIPGYRISLPYKARQSGVELRVLRPSSYGVDFYGDSLFTHQRWIDKDRLGVERFIRAAKKGWEYALNNPEEIADKISRELPRILPVNDFTAFNHFQIEEVRKLTLYPIVELGNTNPGRWINMHAFLKKIGCVTNDIDIKEFIFSDVHKDQLENTLIYGIIVIFIMSIIAFCWITILGKSLQLKTKEIETSLREKELLLREIHHRVNNNMQIISSMIELHLGEVEDEKSMKILTECMERIRAMSLVHEKLYQSKNLETIDFDSYLKELAMALFRTYDINNRITLNTSVDKISLGINNAIPCGLVINELISNALQHAFPGDKAGEINIKICNIGANEIEIHMKDNGIGFQKHIDINSVSSIGLKLVRGIVTHQLGGNFQINSNGGTEIIIRFNK